MSYPNTFRLAQGENFVECPYNKAHQVTNQRFLTHLDKCRTAYKKDMASRGQSVEVVPCRFNWAHQFPKIEISSHETRCQDQYSVIPTLAYHQNELPEKLAREAALKSEPVVPPKKNFLSKPRRREPEPEPEEEGENWDLAAANDYKPGYCPQEKLESKCYLYNPMGLSKSERKQFRLDNRQRYQKEAMNEHLQQNGPAQSQGQGQAGPSRQGQGGSSSSGNKTPTLNTNGRYIPGLNYVDVKVKTEKESDQSEWDKETVGFRTPRRVEEDFSLSNVKTEMSWAAEQEAWETDTVPRSPVRMVDVKEEVKSEPISYTWDED